MENGISVSGSGSKYKFSRVTYVSSLGLVMSVA